MCITAEALAMFLNLISFDIVERLPDQIVIHAETQDTVWTVGADDLWCVERPLKVAKAS
ncbi:MAG: hypothetical protein AAGJ34_04635 [Pseudomonadota bacterium]